MQMIRRTLLSTCVAAMAAASAGAVLAQTKEVKVGYALAVNSHYGAAAQAWADAVEKGTNGAYKFKQFPASALGGERELIEGLQLGTVEAAIVSTGAISNFVPDVGVVDIPFLFRDTQHARAVLDGAFGQELLAKFSKRGLVALAWGEQGFRHLSNNKHAVNGVADLKGLKIRVTENPVHITAFRTLGASPTPMSWPEVIGALQQGTIDGQENPISVLASAKLAGAKAPDADRPRVRAHGPAGVALVLGHAERQPEGGLHAGRQVGRHRFARVRGHGGEEGRGRSQEPRHAGGGEGGPGRLPHGAGARLQGIREEVRPEDAGHHRQRQVIP